MTLSSQLATQFREALLNGTWISTNFKAQLSDVTWEQATTKIGTLNTIAALAFHVNYYVAGVIKVLEGGPLEIRDKYSFDMPPISSEKEWQNLLNKIFSDAERFAELVEEIPDEKLWSGFVDEKYGNYYRNLIGMIEHSYYHLGQVVLLKKLIAEQ